MVKVEGLTRIQDWRAARKRASLSRHQILVARNPAKVGMAEALFVIALRKQNWDKPPSGAVNMRAGPTPSSLGSPTSGVGEKNALLWGTRSETEIPTNG